ncbi:MAG: YlxR family protein [Pleurocapsa minor GSE-CHR-MK-17-07R]|nr:YlxR family protein [Pleurocapsa minor GSE-CHR-MK 17-07R]
MSRHVPVRTCVVCREQAGKRTLTRIVRTDQGIMVDPSGKLNGRGAYLCEQDACWSKAVRSDILGNALRVTLSEDDRERLRRHRLQNERFEPDPRPGSQP